jgi:hypothetical protein
MKSGTNIGIYFKEIGRQRKGLSLEVKSFIRRAKREEKKTWGE